MNGFIHRVLPLSQMNGEYYHATHQWLTQKDLNIGQRCNGR